MGDGGVDIAALPLKIVGCVGEFGGSKRAQARAEGKGSRKNYRVKYFDCRVLVAEWRCCFVAAVEEGGRGWGEGHSRSKFGQSKSLRRRYVRSPHHRNSAINCKA